jgi:endonuclease/exonuclease/phosphatase (EEP) superfamily protein YafD
MQALVTAGAFALALVSLLALAAERIWWADLLVHFRLQYLAIAVLLLGLAVWRRRRAWLAAALLALALNAVPVARQFGVAPPVVAARAAAATAVNAQPPLRIAASNLLWRNRAHAGAIAWARQTQADLLVFVEVDARWEQSLGQLRDAYPFARTLRRAGHSGTLLLSRWPIDAAATLDAGTPGTPELAVDVTTPGGSLRLIAVHATWPLGGAVSAARAREFATIAAAARGTTLPVVVIGDFNVTPWSPHFAALLERGRLRDAAAGFGWQPTWPSFLPPLGLRIDHALLSPGIVVNSFARGRVEGSDHRPIIVDLRLPPQGVSAVQRREPGDTGGRG